MSLQSRRCPKQWAATFRLAAGLCSRYISYRFQGLCRETHRVNQSTMVSKSVTRPRAWVFGILVEGANCRYTARPRQDQTRYSTCSFSRSRPLWSFSSTSSGRSITSANIKTPLLRIQSNGPSSADQGINEELKTAHSVLDAGIVPDERSVQSALEICESLARSLAKPIESPRTPPKLRKGPTSNLLTLEQEPRESPKSLPPRAPLAPPMRTNLIDRISKTAYSIIVEPRVFITSKVLSTYVATQCLLGRPQSFPEVFDLYACKPAAQHNSRPIRYKDSKPNSPASAVPLALAQQAVMAAIDVKDLPLCLSIIDMTVCTSAYKRSKFIRTALLPVTGFALVPAAAYALSSQLAPLQHSFDVPTATYMLTAGIVAYVYFTGTIGLVALATANDQMDRITWMRGTALRHRWMREEERALVDRVAGAWGFQDVHMRGQEAGVEWEDLREWAGRRQMLLDSTEIMEGME